MKLQTSTLVHCSVLFVFAESLAQPSDEKGGAIGARGGWEWSDARSSTVLSTSSSQATQQLVVAPSQNASEPNPGSASTPLGNTIARRLRAQSKVETAPVEHLLPGAASTTAVQSVEPVKLTITASGLVEEPAQQPAPMLNSTLPAQQPAPVLNSTLPAQQPAPVLNSTLHDPCSCEFKGVCTCQTTIEFMDCISAACSSGSCDCHQDQFKHACSSMAAVCTSLEMMCAKDTAHCLVEREAQIRYVNSTSKEAMYQKLHDLKEHRCRLELAAYDGMLNAEGRLIPIRAEIDELIKELQLRQEPIPEMHCEKAFEEWHYPALAPLPSGTHQAATPLALLMVLVHALIFHTL